MNTLSKLEMEDLTAMVENHGPQAVVEGLSVICMNHSNKEPDLKSKLCWRAASSFLAGVVVPFILRR